MSCQPFFVRRRCKQYLINSAGGSWGHEIFLLLSYCSRFFFLKVDLLWQMTSYRNVLKSRWEEAKKSEIWSRQLVMTLIDNYTCGDRILNKILNWMRKTVKNFVLTIMQFYYSFNLKLPTLISVELRGEGRYIFIYDGGVWLFVCLFFKQSFDSLPSPLSFSNKTFNARPSPNL